MVKVVLAGCGAMSAAWLDAIAQVPEIEVAGLVDIDLSRAEAVAAKRGFSNIGIGTDLAAIVSSCGAKAVFDVAIPQARKALVLAAFASGCDVLTEKPMATSMEEARQILEAARKTGRIHAVVQNRRYLANVRRIRRFLDSGAIGRPTSIHADFFIAPHFGGFREEMDHVLLLDMAIHTFDAARYMVNAIPVDVACHEWEPKGSWYKSGSSAQAFFRFRDGTVFNYRGSWCADGHRTSWEGSWRVVCEKGTLLWDGHDNLAAERATGRRDGLFDVTEPIAVPALDPADRVGGHLGVIKDFLAAIHERSGPETAGNDNIHSLAMALGAAESAASGRRVSIGAA